MPPEIRNVATDSNPILRNDPEMRQSRMTRLIEMPQSASVQERLASLEMEAAKLALMLDMSQSLSSYKDLDALMGLIVEHTTRIMDCDRSSVLLLDREKGELYSLVAQGLDVNELRFNVKTGIAGYAVREGVALNIPDAYVDERFNSAFDKSSGYRTRSILCMPMRNRQGETVGVIQCLNKKGAGGSVRIFDKQDETILGAVAAQAAIFIENAALYRRMDALFEAFVEATSRSIDDRDPCTSGHSRRVTLYSLNLARAVHESSEPPFESITYTRDRMRQLRYACLLHDVGKIGVREHILCKAKKLPPGWLETVRFRLEMLAEKRRGDLLLKCVQEKLDPATLLEAEHAPLAISISRAIKFIEKCNAGNFMTDEDNATLEKYFKRNWITPEEYAYLSVKRGNLTAREYADMQSHVTKSWRMLVKIPWPPELRDLPEVAYTHHEKFNGSGYPRRLKGEEIIFDGHIMLVADIYDALTAADRPYKPAIPHEKAKMILEEESSLGQIMPGLVKLFFEKDCHQIETEGARVSQFFHR